MSKRETTDDPTPAARHCAAAPAVDAGVDMGSELPRRRAHKSRIPLLLLLLPPLLSCLLLLSSGCSAQHYLVRRDTPANPLAIPLQISSSKGPQVSSRTTYVLRRFALTEAYQSDPASCLEQLQTLLESEVDGELVYSVAELAYILGKRAEKKGDSARALDMYGVSVSNAYMYLFAREFDGVRNPYDPQFRGACDLYNESLESTLRLVNANGQLHPGKGYQVTTGRQTYTVATEVRGNWSNEDFERFEFVSEFQLDGLPSSGLTYGLGVPLIAVRKKGNSSDPREEYYPDGLSFPVTALLRVVKPGSSPGQGAAHRHHCVLELHDPLASCDLSLAGRLVPLQTDLSTALAYFLDSPQFRQTDSATMGLLNPQKTEKHRGLYMLEPFDPARIPVVMVHGLWSSPVTWMPMFNDLRSFSELRKNYQFWFYQYPTGQPFWLSATQMREDLDQLRNKLDPDRRYQALDQTVLVGHSMGGLVSRLQTIDSRDQFWKLLSDEPFENVRGDSQELTLLRKAAFFTANRDIRRVVTIGTPHRGSDYANDATRWLSRKLIKLPTMMVATGQNLVNKNPGIFQDADLLTNNTSIDSLSPDSPLFPAMLRAPRAPWVTYHNIVGLVPERSWFSADEPARSDGVVAYDSAHMDDAVSEIIVEAEHQTIHRNPKAILEVRRILLEHLEEVRAEYRVAQRLAQQQAQTSGQFNVTMGAGTAARAKQPESTIRTAGAEGLATQLIATP
ncbi:MAG: alpha/beta fold hydrolase [Planctomycetales bacterium]|nr:alpha/beta fold hydrolase [Planctomycetales bacterium]